MNRTIKCVTYEVHRRTGRTWTVWDTYTNVTARAAEKSFRADYFNTPEDEGVFRLVRHEVRVRDAVLPLKVARKRV